MHGRESDGRVGQNRHWCVQGERTRDVSLTRSEEFV